MSLYGIGGAVKKSGFFRCSAKSFFLIPSRTLLSHRRQVKYIYIYTGLCCHLSLSPGLFFSPPFSRFFVFISVDHVSRDPAVSVATSRRGGGGEGAGPGLALKCVWRNTTATQRRRFMRTSCVCVALHRLLVRRAVLRTEAGANPRGVNPASASDGPAGCAG